MSWEDRIVEAAYTGPDGVRLTFMWQSVSRETPLRNTPFDFAWVFNSYVQQNGSGSRVYPIRAIFSGENCDLEATTFERACFKTGIGRLEHPMYGTFQVLPVGAVKRDDDPTAEANQSIVEVTFWTTTDAVYPSANGNPRNEIVAALAAFNAAGAQQFSTSTTLGTVAQKANAAASARALVGRVSGSLDTIVSATSTVEAAYRDAQRAILDGMDLLIEDPLALATQLAELVEIPSKALAPISARLDAYIALAAALFASPQGSPSTSLASGVVLPRRNVTIANDFQIAAVLASSAVAGSISSVLATTFTTRPQAIAAAESVLAQLDAVTAWRDLAFEALGDAAALNDNARIDTGESYQALREAACLTAGYLVEVSFSLVPERRIVLDRPRTIVDLAAQLYGQVDERLDFLIETNDLSGSDILELPAGREIVYYPTPIPEAA